MLASGIYIRSFCQYLILIKRHLWSLWIATIVICRLILIDFWLLIGIVRNFKLRDNLHSIWLVIGFVQVDHTFQSTLADVNVKLLDSVLEIRVLITYISVLIKFTNFGIGFGLLTVHLIVAMVSCSIK